MLKKSLTLIIIINIVSAHVETHVKCCPNTYYLNDNLNECVAGPTKLINIRLQEILGVNFTTSGNKSTDCFQDRQAPGINETNSLDTPPTNCVDFQKNGSLVYLNCTDVSKPRINSSCDSVFTSLHVYGASVIIFANIVHSTMYITVCLLYVVIPGICRRAYDKAVLSFTITQAVLGTTFIVLGHYMLCHKPLTRVGYSLFGITFMMMTIGGVLWLLVISVDVASTVTRLRWVPSSNTKDYDEIRKFRIYLELVLAGTLIPTGISAILQFSPIPDDFIIKPNFHILTSVNYRIIIYVVTIPVLVAIASNVLFIYTTLKVIKIQRSTSVLNENRKKSVKKKYMLYLRLYLLMDAPYITGALGSMFEDLWILKFCRMIQPVVMLYAVLPKHTIVNALTCNKKSKTVRKETADNVAEGVC